MGRTIRFYLNDDDLAVILDLLSERGMTFYDKNKKIVEELYAISHDISIFYMSCNNSSFIEFAPCFYTLKYLQCASFHIESEEDSELSAAFSLIKKYIRQTYMLSQDKTYYIGPGIYQDWLNRKYYFPILLKYQELVVDENDMEAIFNDILSESYIIKTNNVRLRNIDVIDLSAESFVIFAESSKISTTIIRKSIVRYEYGSDCIFVYRIKKSKECVFQLDKRIVDDPSSKSPQLFEKINNSWVKAID